jgi:hypothetical protein
MAHTPHHILLALRMPVSQTFAFTGQQIERPHPLDTPSALHALRDSLSVAGFAAKRRVAVDR